MQSAISAPNFSLLLPFFHKHNPNHLLPVLEVITLYFSLFFYVVILI